MLKTLVRASVLSLGTALLAVLPVTASHAADSVVGDATPGTSSCGLGGAVTYLQTGSTSGRYTVTQEGVVTSYTLAGAEGGFAEVAFNLGRAVPSGFGIVATSDTVTPAATDTVVTRSVRIPARVGDVVGLTLTSGFCARVTDAPQDTYVAFNRGEDGSPGEPDYSSGFQFSVAATVEPDADKDGYGDTSQDLCPVQATTQGACAPFTRTRKVTTTGKAQVGGKVKVNPAKVKRSFTPAPSKVTVQWFRGSQKIKGAKKAAYLITRADVGRVLKAKIKLRGVAPTKTIVVRTSKVRR